MTEKNFHSSGTGEEGQTIERKGELIHRNTPLNQIVNMHVLLTSYLHPQPTEHPDHAENRKKGDQKAQSYDIACVRQRAASCGYTSEKPCRNPQHIGRRKHVEKRDCASVAESRPVSARVPKQFARPTI